MAKTSSYGNFASLREAFCVLSEIYRLNGKISFTRKGLSLSSIPRARWSEILRRVRANEEMVRSLLQGTGQRSSVQGRREVVLSAIAVPGESRVFEVTALLVVGRGAVSDAITVSSLQADWKERLAGFVDWEGIAGVIAAAEGNNQRAMIGMTLQLAGIGRGKIEVVEAELPEEVDEAAQSVRGADWLKSGLPRFENAAGEALWYLMRIRSVHARMIKVRKQGYYTSMALAAMYASGLSVTEMSGLTGMREDLVEKLTPSAGSKPETADLGLLGGPFLDDRLSSEARRAHCAARVWKGAAIYARVLDRRIRVGHAAREAIGAGDDLVTVADRLRIGRRDLVRVLSKKQSAAIAEREKFVGAIIDPALVRDVAR